MEFQQLYREQKAFFDTGKTLPPKERIRALNDLQEGILRHEEEICSALQQDLGKSPQESYLCEIGMVLSELRYLQKHISSWVRPHRVPTPLAQFPARSYTLAVPYGVVLILSPWNYPFLLTLDPLISAVACGNCCVVKPSASAPATAKILERLLSQVFPRGWVQVVTGGRQENQALLDIPFDYIFFTGGVTVGKEVLHRAAEHLTPVTLELGGKSPCIVDATADIDLAAKRIAFGKLLNAGQTCVAPDYILADARVQPVLLERLQFYTREMTKDSPGVHMINRKHYDRVMGLIDPEKVVFGGTGDPEKLHIAPTVLRDVTWEDRVMQEEIFGPVLPVLTFRTQQEALSSIRHASHPLACYLFSRDKGMQDAFRRVIPFGGGCINDTVIHLATNHMGFGGVGGSGMGSYHGKCSLETFSHKKSIVEKSTLIDLPLRYAPYSRLSEALIRLFLH